MEELGRVIEVKERMAKVSTTPKGECSRCDAATLCSSLGTGYRTMEVYNPLKAEKGDIVRVDIPSKSALISALLIFIMPILLVLAGIGIGSGFGGETFMIIGGISGFVIGFLILKVLDKRLKNSERFRPQIVEICAKAKEIKIVKDPVCGMKLPLDETKSSYSLGGRTYYFCSDSCKETFIKNPYRYRNRRGI